MTSDEKQKLVEICFGIGMTHVPKEVPPGTKSLRFRVGCNARHVGYVYVDVNHPNPRQEAERIGRSHEVNEVWGGDPSPLEPINYVSSI